MCRDRGWVNAADLGVGDSLLLHDGRIVAIELVECESLEKPVAVYNFEVADYHMYYVSHSSVLVHNASCGDNGGSNGFKQPVPGSGKAKATDIPSWAKGKNHLVLSPEKVLRRRQG